MQFFSGDFNNQQNHQNHYYYRSPHHHHRSSGIRSVLKSKSKEQLLGESQQVSPKVRWHQTISESTVSKTKTKTTTSTTTGSSPTMNQANNAQNNEEQEAVVEVN